MALNYRIVGLGTYWLFGFVGLVGFFGFIGFWAVALTVDRYLLYYLFSVVLFVIRSPLYYTFTVVRCPFAVDQRSRIHNSGVRRQNNQITDRSGKHFDIGVLDLI